MSAILFRSTAGALRRVFLCSLLIAVTWGLGACASTPESRVKQQQAAFDGYPAEVQAKIRAGEVAVGFTPDQVRLALGKPAEISERTTAAGRSEVWVYQENKPRLGFALGIGGGSGGTSVGTGVGVSSGGSREPFLRVVFEAGVVSAVERATRK